jgi:hypothetical protein
VEVVKQQAGTSLQTASKHKTRTATPCNDAQNITQQCNRGDKALNRQNRDRKEREEWKWQEASQDSRMRQPEVRTPPVGQHGIKQVAKCSRSKAAH